MSSAENDRRDQTAGESGDGAGVDPATLALYREVRRDLLARFREECDRGMEEGALMEFSDFVMLTVGLAILRGRITEWEAEQKAYVYPHVQGIAARVCRDCDSDRITAQILREAAHPWIRDASKRAAAALERLSNQQRSGSQTPLSLEPFFTIYCDDYPD
jgi:hypothetical protein